MYLFICFRCLIRQRGDLSAFRCTESRTILVLGATVQQEPRKVVGQGKKSLKAMISQRTVLTLYEFVRRSWDLFHFSHFSLGFVG